MTQVRNAERRETPTGALRSIRVLDFGHYIPGPLLGMLLADQGADVIKVERPGGDPARQEPAFATWNRGKRSVVLDLKTDQGREQARQLARRADVLIENFRPGVAERLGIGYEELSRLNPRLIYCSLPGFGEESPHRDQQGWEPIIGAATGLYSKVEGTTEPLFTPLPIASSFAAIVGAVAVAMALYARDRSGLGQRVEVPLHSAMFTAMGRHLVRFHEYEPGEQFAFPRHLMARQYQCADGRWVQHHGMFERFARRFLEVAGHPEWTEEPVSHWGKPVDRETLDMWLERFENIFRQRTAEEWEDAINAAGGACVICHTIDEWLEHPHALTSRMVTEVEDAGLGRMKQPGVAPRLRGTPGAIQGRAPLLGEHTEQVLAELEQEAQDSPPTPSQKPSPQVSDIMSALQGVRVLDLCIILAGPTCGRTLAEYGADVIKIDDPTRLTDPVGYVDVNRGKRSIMLNLKTEGGKEVFWRLVDTADVIVENNRKGSLARLGLGYEDVKKRKPDIIYGSLNAFGYDGPWSERAGWEQLAQAASGIQVRRGGRDGAPLTLPYAVNDYGTGMLGAFAVALALHERNRTGQGQLVDSGLALTACFLQSPFFLDYQGFQRRELEGRGVRGYSALSRLYQAADGWLYVHCSDEASRQRLLQLPEFASVASNPELVSGQNQLTARDSRRAAELGKIFLQKPRRYWIDLLASVGVNAIENLTLPDFRDDSSVRRAGLIITREHPGWGRTDHLGNTARLSGTPMQLGRPTPVMGAHTKEILTEAGYSEREITALQAAGAVVAAEA
jgi:crotonobetainyl-CoA:carnitine CoA-transferase CaiB-like acyl-CoA transferase